ncbi:hypothetical protein OESDEN_19063 [Oesophagostomum dentatum]|uniref:Uncharacterized protein n=1 Tax=Oesophagostomum dentatum TaxID=61180 RepID=A0A0B1SBI8_OESDE|nr:hypothetical protein OESDEN_19063 [Oesophagostomum dentatum]
MTMRPRRNVAPVASSESQRRPLLDNGDDSDDMDGPELTTHSAPPPPSHKNLLFNSRVYDDPPYRGGGDTDSLATSAICDIDASDSEDLPVDAVL